jgi:hypothetical protein
MRAPQVIKLRRRITPRAVIKPMKIMRYFS